MEFISSYVLTNNSQKYLVEILDKLTLVADEIIIVDYLSSIPHSIVTHSSPKLRLIDLNEANALHEMIVTILPVTTPLLIKPDEFVGRCPVCFEDWEVIGDKKFTFTCHATHVICYQCAQRVDKCPICRAST